ncbi:MAG: hypothetical protein ACKOS8_09680 [Gemmataceae bacterium]
MLKSWIALSLTLGTVVLLGCSGGPAINEVEGTVTSGGQPLEKVQVNFFPSIDGPHSSALTDASGKFVLKTTDNRSGAIVGTHKVTLTDVSMFESIGRENEGKDVMKGRKLKVPTLYNDVKTTPLSQEVKSGAKNSVKIDIK